MRAGAEALTERADAGGGCSCGIGGKRVVRNVWVWLVFDGGLEDQPTVLGVWP